MDATQNKMLDNRIDFSTSDRFSLRLYHFRIFHFLMATI